MGWALVLFLGLINWRLVSSIALGSIPHSSVLGLINWYLVSSIALGSIPHSSVLGLINWYLDSSFALGSIPHSSVLGLINWYLVSSFALGSIPHSSVCGLINWYLGRSRMFTSAVARRGFCNRGQRLLTGSFPHLSSNLFGQDSGARTSFGPLSFLKRGLLHRDWFLSQTKGCTFTSNLFLVGGNHFTSSMFFHRRWLRLSINLSNRIHVHGDSVSQL